MASSAECSFRNLLLLLCSMSMACSDDDAQRGGTGGNEPFTSSVGAAGGTTSSPGSTTDASSSAASTSSGSSNDGLLDCAEEPTLCDAGGCHLMLAECEMVSSSSPIVLDQAPMVIRTPALSGPDPDCEVACLQTAYAFNVVFDLADPNLANQNLVVRAPAPWSAALAHEGYALVVCDDPSPGQVACMFPADKPPTTCIETYGATGASVAISTTDPMAPSVDIEVEVAGPGGCEE